MRATPKIRKLNDREVIAQAQFRTGAGAMDEKHRDPKRRRMLDRREEARARNNPEES